MGSFRSGGIALLAVAAIGVAGCSSSRLSSLNSTEPEPLAAAPSGTVTGTQLPPPGSPTAAGVTDPTAFPPPPGADPNAPPGTSPTATAAVSPPANAPDLTASAMTGVWTASVAGQTCQVVMALTKYGSAYRAAPLRCPEQLPAVKSWNVRGKQLVLFDEGGSEVATLYSSAAKRFDGQTKGGQPISLALQ